MKAAILRLIRAGVSMGLPVLISYLAGHPNALWAGLAPVIMAISKYLRDNIKGLDWLPV
jgi:uncharacterized membrane protein YgaE (UPF0421/DUF939 family)